MYYEKLVSKCVKKIPDVFYPGFKWCQVFQKNYFGISKIFGSIFGFTSSELIFNTIVVPGMADVDTSDVYG